MLTIEAFLLWRSKGTASRVQLNCPVRQMSRQRSQSSGFISSTLEVGPAMPALLTSTSRPRRFPVASSNSRLTALRSETSHLVWVMEGSLAASDPSITQTKCDVSDRNAVKRLFEEATGNLRGLDVLVNNAGIAGPTSKVEEMNPEDWDRCLDICLTGQFNCTRLAVPLLRQSKNASIVNISSAAGRLGFAMRSPYAAAKWGVIGFTKSLSIEIGRAHV